MFEFRGSDLTEPQAQADYAEVYDYLARDDGEAPDDFQDAFEAFAAQDPDAAWSFVDYLARHNSPRVQGMAGIFAVEAVEAGVHRDEAISLLGKMAVDADESAQRRIASYLRDALKDGQLEDAAPLSLKEMVKIIRVQKRLIANVGVQTTSW